MRLIHVLRLGRELVILVYGMAVVASFTFLGQELYRSALWHQPFVLLLTFAVGLIAAAVNIPIPALHRLPRWLLVCLNVIAGGLIDVLIHSAAATRLWQANPVGFLRR